MGYVIDCGGAETLIPTSTTFSGHCCGLRGNPLDLSNLGIQILAKAKINVTAGGGDLHAEAIKELDDKCSQAARSFGQEIKHLHSVIEKLGVENSRLKGQEED